MNRVKSRTTSIHHWFKSLTGRKKLTSIPHSELLQTLDISAGAAISGWGTESKVDSKFLDKTEVLSTSLKDLMKMRFLMNNSD